MQSEQLLEQASQWTADYLKRQELGVDEELQTISAAYTKLFLTACCNKSPQDLAEAHAAIAECFEKLGEDSWVARHRAIASTYKTL